MLLFESPGALREQLSAWRRSNQTLALVPTMGCLHAGHMLLVERARATAERVVVSLFVNPTQFAAGEDYERYPRTFAEDSQLLREAGVDALFAPSVDAMYPPHHATTVSVRGLSDLYCGAFRPGHFQGVATVVNMLFNLIQPDYALFGEKDYQQWHIIRRMVEDLLLPVQIIPVPTVREADGLALSSRNRYLTAEQRAIAPRLYQTLCEARHTIVAGMRDYPALAAQYQEKLRNHGLQPDYFAIARRSDLLPATPCDTQLVLLTAARLGETRLIDNLQVDI